MLTMLIASACTNTTRSSAAESTPHMPVVSTVGDAPVTPALVRLRWYDVDEDFQPRLMGESRWGDVQPAAP